MFMLQLVSRKVQSLRIKASNRHVHIGIVSACNYNVMDATNYSFNKCAPPNTAFQQSKFHEF